MHNKKIYFITAVSIFIILGIVYWNWWNQHRSSADIFMIQEAAGEVTEGSNAVQNEDSEAEDFPKDTGADEEWIYVYVCGCVNNPGVYSLERDARMFQAIEMAGGIREDGCADYLGMAERISDGERIYIPSKEEIQNNPDYAAEKTSESSVENDLININMASKEQLMTLPGIGEAKADAIIQYRKDKGGFSRIEDIMNISGIKEAAFSKIKDYICVSF